jgi:hypothetical protein
MLGGMVSSNAAGRAILGGFVLALAAMTVAHADPMSLGDALFGRGSDGLRTSAPQVARYVSDDGASFVLDRTGGSQGLLKFEDSPEVWVLAPQSAPRGDIIYKNDLGEPMLRVTRLGGVTLFTPTQSGGVPVALSGESSPLRLAPMSLVEFQQRIIIIGDRITRAAKKRIELQFQVNNVSAPLVADAYMVLSDAVVHVAQRVDGKKILANFSKIDIDSAKKPSVKLEHSVLEIRVTPSQGLAGRPSSERIARAIGAR